MSRLCREHPELRDRLTDAVAFTEGRAALPGPELEDGDSARVTFEGPLRHPALRPPGAESLIHTLEARSVEALVAERAALIAATRARRWRELRPQPLPGRIVACAFDESLSDGAACLYGRGYVDDDNIPAWDTWLMMIEAECWWADPDWRWGEQRLLLAYVPPAWIALLDYGMEINLDGCLGWA